MAQPANVMTTAPKVAYHDKTHDELAALAEKRGIEFAPGYVKKDDLVTALEAQDAERALVSPSIVQAAEGLPEYGPSYEPGSDLGATENFVAPGQPAHRYDANKPKAVSYDRGDVAYLSRDHLIRLARGEEVEIDGLKLMAGPDFPDAWKLNR